MKELEGYFKGLADLTRLRLLNLLLEGELCGCDMQRVLCVSQPNVSRHLAYLKSAGLVADRREGYRIFYRLCNRDSEKVAGLVEYLRRAFGVEPSLQRDLERLRQAMRAGACSRETVPAARGASDARRRRTRLLRPHVPLRGNRHS